MYLVVAIGTYPSNAYAAVKFAIDVTIIYTLILVGHDMVADYNVGFADGTLFKNRDTLVQFDTAYHIHKHRR